MKRQLECVTFVTKLDKLNNATERTIEPSEHTPKKQISENADPPDVAMLHTKQLKEIENAKECLKDMNVQKPWQPWPPKEEIPTLVHHTPSRNPLAPFSELKDPLENREYADSWRDPLLPSLGSRFRYSDRSGLNEPTPADAMVSWFKHKKADVTNDSPPEGLPGLVSLLHNLSDESMNLPPLKSVQPPAKPLKWQGGKDKLNVGDNSAPAQSLVLTVVRQSGKNATLHTIQADDAPRATTTSAKRKNEKEASVQTSDPPAPLKPAEAQSKSPPARAPKGTKVSRTVSVIAATETSSSESEDSPRSAPHSPATQPVSGFFATQPVSGFFATPLVASPAEAAPEKLAGMRPRRQTAGRVNTKSLFEDELEEEEERRAIAERKARDRYNEYLDMVNGLPRRCVPQLNGDEDVGSSDRHPGEIEPFMNYPPWTYFLDTHTVPQGSADISTVVPTVELPRLRESDRDDIEFHGGELPGFSALEQLTGLFAPGFKEFLYPDFDPSEAPPMAIPMVHVINPDAIDVWQEVAESALCEEWELTQKEWGSMQEAQIQALRKTEQKIVARQETEIRQRLLAERKKDSDQEVRSTQRRITQKIQREYDEFVSTSTPLQLSMQQPLNKGLRAIGNCRGGRRAWTLFDRSIRIGEVISGNSGAKKTANRWLSLPAADPSYKRQLNDDTLDFVPPPSVGRSGRQATRAGRSRVPGGCVRAARGTASLRSGDESPGAGDGDAERDSELTGRRGAPVEGDFSLASEEEMETAVEQSRQRDLDRMLREAAPKMSPDFPRRFATSSDQVEQRQPSPPAGGSLQGQQDADTVIHSRTLKQRMRGKPATKPRVEGRRLRNCTVTNKF
ncbi:conserved hypothetical protein [Neospora caninum Liverpool]|uniref:Uncharacterized protein n=1 Tax=Neospora caninum (strain Liverpool) TaxID=572307 RepID=F0VIA5_NEOCL|nr:conserved hypothetical protein [Neospora caninum Liverpool]CBZ53466.1 conserved hypothetical protein [Neospora caninum Liverpool]|eukprot:XP_003883498.1 conserved hypothetical protein [Neospora caninum Liverpool]